MTRRALLAVLSLALVGTLTGGCDQAGTVDKPVAPKPAASPPRGATETEAEAVENSLGMRLVRIPAGAFEMGSAGPEDQKPIHRVRLTRPFLIGHTEVTQGQWERVMNTKPWLGQQQVAEGSDLPATFVSWRDASEFCQKLTQAERQTGRVYRLPTEAEWEYACRAGTTTNFSFGNNPNLLGDYAWFLGQADPGAGQRARPVGQKKPNPWGLFDMHGNVWEWCSDSYQADYYAQSPELDPQGPAAGGQFRVIRGGSWKHPASLCRSSARSVGTPAGKGPEIGFRVVCETP